MAENTEIDKLKSQPNNVSHFKFSSYPNFEEIRAVQHKFIDERNWHQYHTPRNLLLAMVAEVGELSELFQWRGEVKESLPDWTPDEKNHLGEELSDVFLYLLRLSEQCQIDLPSAVMKKIAKNKEKYPAPKAYGSSKKYTEYQVNISQSVRLAYKSYEPAGGANDKLTPVIFLHGIMACKEHWTDIPQVVADHTKRRAYAIDARNHGDSEWTDDFSFNLNVEDLFYMMDTIGINKAILVGHSMGGITAATAALMKPERIEKIVVEDMTTRKAPKELVQMVLMYATIGRKAIEAAPPELDENGVKQFVMNFIIESVAKILPPEMRVLERGAGDPAENIRFLMVYRDKDGRWDLKNNIRVIEKALQNPDTMTVEINDGTFDGPACFIYGKESPFLVGADEQHIKQHFPNVIFEAVEGAGHSVHTDKPLEFKDALLQFIS